MKVVDSQGNTATQNYTLTIYPDLSITPTTLPAGTVGTPYSQTFTATGGSGGPFTFSVASETALSAVGLSLSSEAQSPARPTPRKLLPPSPCRSPIRWATSRS